jgi:hypothetical protein
MWAHWRLCLVMREVGKPELVLNLEVIAITCSLLGLGSVGP